MNESTVAKADSEPHEFRAKQQLLQKGDSLEIFLCKMSIFIACPALLRQSGGNPEGFHAILCAIGVRKIAGKLGNVTGLPISPVD